MKKEMMKELMLSVGIKAGIALVLTAAVKCVVEESDSTAIKVVYAVSAVGAYLAGSDVADKILSELYDKYNQKRQSNKSLREILDSYFIKRRIKMTGWILFTAVISLVIGIVLGWILCTWALANYIIRNGTLLKKEENEQTKW